jgi:hypothetical protein
MSRFNFGNRRNNGSSGQDRYDREVYFNKHPQGYETQDHPYHQQEEPDYGEPRLNARENERGDFRQYPPSSQQQDDHYFRGGEHPQVPTRTSSAGRSDFPQLRGYTKAGPNQDELKGLSFWREEDEPRQQDDPESWNDRPSPFKFVIAISGLVALTAIAWFGYRWLSQSTNDTPPLIQSEPGPFKVRPENPGGIAIPHQDKLVYGRLASPSGTDQPVERLLPPPDQHVVMPNSGYAYAPGQQPQLSYPAPSQQQNAGGYVYDQQQGNQGGGGYPVPAYPNAQGYPPQVAAGQVGPENGYAQQQQQTVQQQGQPYGPGYHPAPTYQGQPYLQQPQQQGGQLYPTVPGQQQPGMGYPPPAAPGQPSYPGGPNQPGYADPSHMKSNSVPPQMNNAYLHGIEEANETETVVASPEKEVQIQKPVHKGVEKTSAAAVPGQTFFIQLGTLPTEQMAKQEADRLSRKYKQDLIGFEPTVRMVIVNGNKVYRVVSGPFKTRNAALAKSNKLGSSSKVVQLLS